MPGLNRAVGAAAGSTLALALLVCGCVFAAMAGPALSLHARSQALHQTTAKLAPTVKAVQVSANWSNFVDALVTLSGANQNVPVADLNLTANQLAQAAREIKTSLAGAAAPARRRRLVRPEREPGRGHLGRGPQRGAERQAAQARGALPRPADQQRRAGRGQLRGRRRASRNGGGGGHHADGGPVRAAPGKPR